MVGRDQNLGRETFHLGSRNKLKLLCVLNLPFSLDRMTAIIIVLCAKFHTILCKKIATVNTGLEIHCNLKYFYKIIYSRNVWVARI